MPAAATEKVAVWPEVTVWFVGCVLIDGPTEAELLLLATIPEHPVSTIANSTDNNTRAQRVILRLFHEIFSGARLVGIEMGHRTGEHIV